MPKHLIYLPKRNPNLSIDEFVNAWKEHSQLGKTCVNVRKFITQAKQCARVGYPDLAGISQIYDGVAILTLSEATQSSQIWDDPEVLAIMKPDELRVFDSYVKSFTLETTSLYSKLDTDGSYGYGFIQLLSIDNTSRTEHRDQELYELFREQEKINPQPLVKQEVIHAVTHQPSDQYNYDYVIETWFDSKEDAIAYADKKNLSVSNILTERFSVKKVIRLLLTVTHNRT